MLKDKLAKWLPIVSIGIRLAFNIWLMNVSPENSYDYSDAGDVIASIIISFIVIFIPMVIIGLILIKDNENLKYGLISATWIWLFAFISIYSIVAEPPPHYCP